MKDMTIAKKGRSTDTVLGHLTKGELVIPAELLESKELTKILKRVFEVAEVDMDAYIVGNPKNSINPETGHPEFFFKKLKKAVKKVTKSVKKVFKKVTKPIKKLGKKIDDEVFQPIKNKVTDDILNIDPPKPPPPPLGNPKEAPQIDKEKKKKKKTARSSISAARSRMSAGNKQYRAGGNLSISGGSGPNIAG